jgi:hypothetical protein
VGCALHLLTLREFKKGACARGAFKGTRKMY